MSIFSKKQFNAAVQRLRKAIPLSSIIEDVCHQLKKNKLHSLAESLRLAFEQIDVARDFDRKRAENALSTALYNEDYNVTSAKLKSMDESPTSMSDLMMHHSHEIKNTCYTLSEAGQRQHRTIAFNIESVIRKLSKNRIALSEFDFDSDKNSEQDVLQLIASLVETFGIQDITTLGAADVLADTMEGSDVDVDVYITFTNGSELHLNFEAEKINGDINQLTTTITIDGNEAVDFVKMSDTESLGMAFYDLGFYLCSAPAEADLVDMSKPYYRTIAENVIPAMRFAASFC